VTTQHSLEFTGEYGPVQRNFDKLGPAVFAPVPQARVYGDTSIAIGSGATTAIAFNSERWDEGNLHSTGSNTSRLTAPVTGLYMIGGHFRFAANSTGVREGHIRVNGSTFIAYAGDDDPGAAQPSYFNLSTAYQLTAGDYVELTCFQNSGGNLDVVASAQSSPEFWMVRLAGFTAQVFD
jgi:hypothetical protein